MKKKLAAGENFQHFNLLNTRIPLLKRVSEVRKKLCGVSSCIRYAQKALLKSDESVNKDVMSPELFVVLDLDENRGFLSKSGKLHFR